MTGAVDRETWNKLQEIYKKTLNKLPEKYKKYEDEIYPGRFLSLGMSRDDVEVLQNYLLKICEKSYDIPEVKLTGIFDKLTEITEKSIKVLEKGFVHEVNGIVGPKTWQKTVELTKKWQSKVNRNMSLT
ncbi:MAG: peptidoglycan-binding domain-containing protein [bacterium]|nr:peptidoglycan-binding domain-containing protein [bacterium]